jgi:tyrosine-protein phosphatase YwqE
MGKWSMVTKAETCQRLITRSMYEENSNRALSRFTRKISRFIPVIVHPERNQEIIGRREWLDQL